MLLQLFLVVLVVVVVMIVVALLLPLVVSVWNPLLVVELVAD